MSDIHIFGAGNSDFEIKNVNKELKVLVLFSVLIFQIKKYPTRSTCVASHF